MTWRSRWAVLVLLILAAVLPGWAESLPMRPEQGQEIPWSTGPSGWMVWFEDETFEDCGPIYNDRVKALDTELARRERESSACLDVWQPALPHFLATEKACQAIQVLYGKAAEEFRCSRERPTPQNDDR